METVPAADRQVEEIESLCMNCHANGTTRLLLTRIPFFREIVIMSFSCPSCHFQNAEIQPAGEIQQRGIKYTFRVETLDDLQRQLVKSDTCVCRFEEVDLEIPPGRGQLTNIEGVVAMVKQDLQAKQEERKNVDESLYQQVQVVINKLATMLDGTSMPFTISVDDPAGNSSIEPSSVFKSGKYIRTEYARTAAQNEALGLGADSNLPDTNTTTAPTEAPDTDIRPEYHASQMYPAMDPKDTVTLNQDDATLNQPNDEDDIIENKVYSFPDACPGCTRPAATNMKMVNIPHFKQVVLMSTTCEHCGYRSNEVKTGGEVPDKGRRITLQVLNKEDLSRDILKAESCALSCPELQLNVEPGTLGGRFTTVEGLLTQVRDDLYASVFDTGDQASTTDNGVGQGGDSMPSNDKEKWTAFFSNLNRAINGEMKFTIVLEDPLAASYVQSFKAPDPDEHMAVEDYQRTEAEEEDLGLRDIVTEGYEGDPDLQRREAEKNAGDVAVNGDSGDVSGKDKENELSNGTQAQSNAAEEKEPIDVEEIQRAIRSQLSLLGAD